MSRSIILMGVSGSGKSTVGEELASRIGGEFADGDRFHSEENVAKMASGAPLDDADRAQWLQSMREFLESRRDADAPTILACSALKKSYRDVLRRGDPAAAFVFLTGPKDLIAERLAERTDHYMPASLLDSQFEALEPPEHAVTVSIDQTPEEIAAEIESRLGLARH